MSELASQAKRIEAVKAAESKNAIFNRPLNYPVGKYHFRILDENKAFSTRDLMVGADKKTPMTLFLARGEIIAAENVSEGGKSYEAGEVLEKGYKPVSVDVPELWADMREGVVYSFEIETYEKEKIVGDETKTEIRKTATNWSVVGEEPQEEQKEDQDK